MSIILTKHKMPEQDPKVRAKNFDEVALGYDKETAIAEAQRCLNCKAAPCMKGCPVNVNIPAFIQEVKADNMDGALKIIKEVKNVVYCIPEPSKNSRLLVNCNSRVRQSSQIF